MIWMLVISLFLPPAPAATVLFQGSSRVDYRATLKADPELISPTEYHLKSRPTVARRDELLAMFAHAQRAFLENQPAEARQSFLGVVGLLGRDDWSLSERSIFLNAYLRLAQLEADPGARRTWLADSLTLGSDLVPDADLFPPPLLQERAQLAIEVPRFRLPERWFEEGWQAVLINGQVCRVGQACPTWPRLDRDVRLTFLSDRWATVEVSRTLAGLEIYQPPRQGWFEGNCESPRFHSAADSIPARRVACAAPVAAPLVNERLQPTVAPAPEFARVNTKEEEPKFYQNKWLWAGVGVLAVAIVMSAQGKDEKSPTTTYGY